MTSRALLVFRQKLSEFLAKWSMSINYFELDEDLVCVTARLAIGQDESIEVHNYIPFDSIPLPDQPEAQAVELLKRTCDCITLTDEQGGFVPTEYLRWRNLLVPKLASYQRGCSAALWAPNASAASTAASIRPMSTV